MLFEISLIYFDICLLFFCYLFMFFNVFVVVLILWYCFVTCFDLLRISLMCLCVLICAWRVFMFLMCFWFVFDMLLFGVFEVFWCVLDIFLIRFWYFWSALNCFLHFFFADARFPRILAGTIHYAKPGPRHGRIDFQSKWHVLGSK